MLNVSLDDKYSLDRGRVYLTGTQALVRLTLEQRRRDQAAGLNTAGYVTGYRGSPLGGMDREFGRAKAELTAHHVRFHPAVNEDLAATAIWGSQQVGLYPDAKYDGVFSMWYGKGPGVDRSGDVFRHGNFAGTAPNGGVLVLAGDDPACKSSTVPSQSEHALADAQIPLLHPANVQEVLDFGLYGWAMSRYSGCWVGMKCITDNIDSSASVLVDPGRTEIIMPTDFEMPADGLHIRWPDPPLEQEHRLQRYKIYAALAFARANHLDRVTLDSDQARLGIVATGKSYLDTLQALDDLGIDQTEAERIGIRLYKVGMPWPLEREGVRAFAEGLEEILIVEEKRAIIENQLKEQLYNCNEGMRPRVVGKFDENGDWVLPSAGELTPARIARVIAARIARFHKSETVEARLAFLEQKERALENLDAGGMVRIPYFCSGCPHNTSTKIPEGSRAAAGIGCHYMAIWMDRETSTFTHMGGEGANWIGQAPFSETKHIFTNLGDGTYFHSGILAIRAAVSAGVNITYKILYNDAVAMTGGQPMDGPLDAPRITRQVAAEGVTEIVVVSDEPEKFAIGMDFAKGVTVHHRSKLDEIQRRLRDTEGVTVIVYEQTCAAEKRRRRKRGIEPDPPKRAFINDAVCEGCGDCGIASNCVSLAPLESELGRKRQIDQSSCNKDFSCVDGFCPSFVTVHGAEPVKPVAMAEVEVDQPFPALPEPQPADSSAPYAIVIAGVGGTGVVTISAVLAMAAHVSGKGVTVLDLVGLAQKNGAVYAHIRIADDPARLHAVRIAAGGADLLIGCDLVSSGSLETLAKLRAERTRAVVNGQRTMTAEFTRDPDLHFPERRLHEAIEETTSAADFVEATDLAVRLLGDSIAANMFLVGFAYQKGLLPLTLEAIEAAIDLNGVAPAFNKRAILWGRRAAHDAAAVRALLKARSNTDDNDDDLPGSFVDRRIADLTAYQDAAYAARYKTMVDRAAATERQQSPGASGLADAVARSYFKLLAIKDEYEVARLYTDGAFTEKLRRTFGDDYRLTFHMAAPLIADRDPRTGHLIKRPFNGAWMMPLLKLTARMKGLRGTPFDPFGRSPERAAERRLIEAFEATIKQIFNGLTTENHAIAVQIADLPMEIRGFGHVKEAAAVGAHRKLTDLMVEFTGGPGARIAAE